MEAVSRPPVSVVIPSFNGLRLLRKQLPQVCDELTEGDELIIVDDASSDQSPKWLQEFKNQLKKERPELSVNIIVNQRNLRFVGSVNEGFKAATNDYVLLLNNDVFPRKGLLGALFVTWNEFASAGPIFAIGCREFEKLDSGEVVVSGKNQLWFERGMFLHSRSKDITTGPTAWVSGGSGLFDRRKWLELGGMDPKFYPAYWEDIDISVRARVKDWQVLFSTKAEVDHRHETTNKEVFGSTITLYSWKNAFYFTWKHMNYSQWAAHLFWLPYHLIIGGARHNFVTWRALAMATASVIKPLERESK